MRASFYHYYFVNSSSPARVCYDLRPILKAYHEFPDKDWKANISSGDGESVILLQVKGTKTHMLVATRKQELIKAINTRELTYDDLYKKLADDEEAGFAAYFTLNHHALALVSTLRGPRQAALCDFINLVLTKLQATNWKFGINPIGSAMSIREAKALAFVGRTSIQIGRRHPISQRIINMLGTDNPDIDSFVLSIVPKRGKNIKNIFDKIANEAKHDELDKFQVKAKKVTDDALTDYFIEAAGKLSRPIENDSEHTVVLSLEKALSAEKEYIDSEVNQQRKELLYDENLIARDLTNLCRANHWRSTLLD